MKDGFIRAAALTPKIRVADPAYNAEQIIKGIGEAAEKVVMTSSVNDAYEQFLSAAESGAKSAHAGRKKTVTSMSKTDKKGGARKKK